MTNIRAGAVSPVAGMVHAVTLAVVVLAAAPLAAHIPLAVLAGVLLFVAWNMGEWREFARLRQFSNHYRLMLMSTFLLTIVFDLTVAVELGLVLAIVLFVRRQAEIFVAEEVTLVSGELHYRMYGSLFFGAIGKLDKLIAAVESGPQGVAVQLDLSMLVALDTTGLDSLEQLLKAVQKKEGSLSAYYLQPQPRSLMERTGFIKHLHRCS